MYFFFFNDTATTEIYTLSLHDALPIFGHGWRLLQLAGDQLGDRAALALDEGDVAEQRLALEPLDHGRDPGRSEEHTSELQSRQYLVCRLLLEKKKIKQYMRQQMSTI